MATTSPLSEANTAFALDLLRKLSDDEDKNVFFSPFSISSALAMALLGARGNTAQQMSEVLHFNKAEKSEFSEEEEEEEQQQQELQQQVQFKLSEGLKADDVSAGFKKLLSELNKPGAPYALSVANRLYGEQSFHFLMEYLESISKYYGELESVNFKSGFEAVRLDINRWVEEQTQGKIQDLLANGMLTSMTKLVLVNAIYFKGTWERIFDERATHDAEFRITKNDKKQVKMMFQEDKFPFTFIPQVNCQILELPYKGRDLSMFIFLPEEVADGTTGLEKLEAELTYENFVEWTQLARMDVVSVEVKMPRFKMEEEYGLKDVLVSMGMVDAFSDSLSDFTGMSPDRSLTISDVVHKAYVEVNEKGTEAAAATGVVVRTSMYIPPKEFTADHPFLLFIQHNPSRSIVFAGRCCNPE
ncbi:leukocyte elastase inhibitor-like [Nelusetta ayraudi]|uniref:leukocyte elastase inhibitor-like n=1 Tax=Nelusetta ayraudi TaxID=303726 RepID=UPI003F722385